MMFGDFGSSLVNQAVKLYYKAAGSRCRCRWGFDRVIGRGRDEVIRAAHPLGGLYSSGATSSLPYRVYITHSCSCSEEIAFTSVCVLT